MKIEDIITHQNKLVASYESKIAEMEDTIKKYPWSKMGYDFPDWREYEIASKMQKIAEVKIIIEALEKQIPKEIIKSSFGVAFCPICEKSVWQNKDESQYCFRCGQALKWGE